MIPVLGVPTLTRYDLLQRMLASVDEPVGQIIVVDNGGYCPEPAGTHVIHLPANLGVAAAWNLVLKATPRAPWWAIVNDDLTFAPGDLARLINAMSDESPRLATLDGFSAFGINRVALEIVGFFDENFHPAYCEDADYEYRCRLVGVPIVAVPAGLRHERSSTIALDRYRRQNDRTYPENVQYFKSKWGGPMRGGEVYTAPFNGTGGPNDWNLDPRRLRDLSWETPVLWPEAETP